AVSAPRSIIRLRSGPPAPRMIASSELRTKDVGDRVGDVLPMPRASPSALFDLDAVCSVGGEPVDDVLQAVTAELLVWGRNVDCYVSARLRLFAGSFNLLPEGGGRSPADENVEGDFGVVEPMEGDGIGEAPRDDRVEAGETRLVNVGRGDVPASKGGFPLKALAPPQTDRVGRESRGHALGLSVGMRLDVSSLRCDDPKAGMVAFILQPFDELVVGFGVGVIEGGMWHLGIERTDEFVARAEPLPASRAHANDIVRPLLANLADRVQSVLRVVALDPNLMSTFT